MQKLYVPIYDITEDNLRPIKHKLGVTSIRMVEKSFGSYFPVAELIRVIATKRGRCIRIECCSANGEIFSPDFI